MVDVKDMEIQQLKQDLEQATVKLRKAQYANIELRAEFMTERFLYQHACELLFSSVKMVQGTARGLRKQLADQIRRKRVGQRICRRIIDELKAHNEDLCDRIATALAEKHGG